MKSLARSLNTKAERPPHKHTCPAQHASRSLTKAAPLRGGCPNCFMTQIATSLSHQRHDSFLRCITNCHVRCHRGPLIVCFKFLQRHEKTWQKRLDAVATRIFVSLIALASGAPNCDWTAPWGQPTALLGSRMSTTNCPISAAIRVSHLSWPSERPSDTSARSHWTTRPPLDRKEGSALTIGRHRWLNHAAAASG